MKRTLGFYLRLAAVMLLFFALWKPVFMLFNGAAGRGCGAGDFLSVIMHGLPLDLATTGYTLALPLLLLLVNIWVRVPGLRKIFLVYYAILSLTAGLVLVGASTRFGTSSLTPRCSPTLIRPTPLPTA